MEQKNKFILIGLIIISVVFMVLFMQTLSSKQVLMREKDDLKKENTSLSGKIQKIESSLRDYEKRVDSLNNELERAAQENEAVERKFELVNREKEELVEKLKFQSQQAAPARSTQSIPAATDAYWAGILKAKTDLDMQMAELKDEFRSLKITNEDLEREKSVSEFEINNLKRNNDDLKRQMDYNQKLLDSIAQELVREKNDKSRIQESIKVLKNENTVLTRQLRSLNNRKISLERRLQEAQAESLKAQHKFSEMDTMLSSKLSQIDGLKDQLDAIRGQAMPIEGQVEKKESRDSVALPPIVVRSGASGNGMQDTVLLAPQASSVGKVLAVNRESNFVIVDKGEDSGINLGDPLQVYRDGANIASLEVIQTRKNISACDIKKEDVSIKIGDSVQ